MNIFGESVKISYEISRPAFEYLVYKKALAGENPSVLSDIVIPQLIETGDENLEVIIEGNNATVLYIPEERKINRVRAAGLNN